ncbi:MAG: TetR/AcrR family transcriptional regulator [Firmicutes bacterium]|nr:TetR/AcrR family transcriptional regulator [Bacillota bacterium]
MRKIYHKKTFEGISEEKRNNLLDVAAREFACKGFDNANINDIAAGAGISVGSIYKYFDTKKDLFLTCVNLGIDTLEKVMNEILISNDDIFVKIEKIVRTIQSFSRSHRNLTILYNEMTSESNVELTWEAASQMESISAKVYTFLIGQAQENGAIREDVSPGFLAFFLDNLFVMLQFAYSCDYYRKRFEIYAGKEILDDDELLLEQFMNFIKAAFKSPIN